jgi:hypothetical protein
MYYSSGNIFWNQRDVIWNIVVCFKAVTANRLQYIIKIEGQLKFVAEFVVLLVYQL